MSTNLNHPSATPAPPHQYRPGLLTRGWHYLAISLLTLVYYFPYLIPRMGNMHGGDFAWFYLPFRIYSSQQVHEGSWPFRAAEIFGGYPIWQDPQFSLLYPVNLLFAIVFPNFASETVIDLYMLTNMLILSWASIFFLRRIGLTRAAAVAGACVIAFCGYTINHAQYLAFLQVESMSLIAAGLLVTFFRGHALDFRLPLAAGITLALGNLTGNPQPIVYFHYALGIGLVILAAELWRRTRSKWAGLRMLAGGATMFTFGILLAIVHLLPSAFLIAMSPRAKVLRVDAAWTPLELKNYLMMLFPGFYQVLPWRLEWPPYQVDVTLSVTNLVEGYNSLGIFAVALGLLGWWHYRKNPLVHVLGIGCVLLMLCALGDQTPVYGILYTFFPAISLLRVSARILLVFYPAWAILVGLGIQALAAAGRNKSWEPRAIVLVMIAIVALSAALVFRGHDSWLNAWLGMMAEFARVYVLDNGVFYMQHMDQILYGLKLQLVLGAIFLVALVILFFIRHKAISRSRIPAVISVMFVELFIYGFGWNMAINTPPLDDGIVHEFNNFPREVKGRTLGLHPFFHGSINAPIYMKDAPPAANGYSVTFDRWVGMFLPVDRAPFSSGVQGTLYDLWNITDVQYLRQSTWAALSDFPQNGTIVGDWGWTPLQRQPDPTLEVERDVRALAMPHEFTVDLETTQPAKAVHLLITADGITDQEDGTELGLVSLQTTSGDWTSTTPLRIGEHVSERSYPLPEETNAPRPSHSLASVAYRRHVPSHDTHGSAIYDVKIEPQTSAPLQAINFQVTAPYPAMLGVAHIVTLFPDDTSTVTEAFEVAGFKKMPSRHALYYTLGRDYHTGYIRVLPTAVGSSYKKMHFPFAKAVSGEIDPLQTVIVDKRQFPPEELLRLNAPDPADFQASATITWHSDEHATIKVEANQSGWVFLSYAWDAGWRATINGQKTPIHRGTGPFMTIPVDAGNSVIEMRYRPRGLILGTIISLTALIGLLAAWRYAGHWHRRLAHPQPPNSPANKTTQ